MGRARVTMAFVLLLGVLAAPRAGAQAPGSELSEAISSDAGGADAYVALASVEAFPADGGEAVFEPGTDYEEVFSYATADADTNRLVGLTRSAPASHAAGVFVQAPGSTATPTSTPSPSPTPAASSDSTPAPAGADAGEPQNELTSGSANEEGSADGDSASSTDGEASSNDETASDTLDPCLNITGKTCVDTVLGVLALLCTGELCGLDDPCGTVGIQCDTSDPCDPDNVGQTCGQWLAAVMGQFGDPNEILDGACDPADNGQTCEDEGYLNDYLAGLLPPLPNGITVAADAANSVDIPAFHEKCRPVIRQPPTKDGILITAKGKYTCDEVHEYTYALAGMFIAPHNGGPWKPFGTIGQDATYNSTRAFAKSTGECRSGKWAYMVVVGGQAGSGDGSDPWPHYHNTGKFKTSDPVIIKCPRVPSTLDAPSEPAGVGTE